MILFSHKFGQLGNRLFAFSHLIANAAAHNYRIVNLSFDEYAKYFESTSKDPFCGYPAVRNRFPINRIRTSLFTFNKAVLKMLRKLSFTKSQIHEIVVADLPEYNFLEGRYFDLNGASLQKKVAERQFIFLFGRFFRDFQNFGKHQDLIRDFFKPTLAIQNSVNQFITKARVGNKILVGVHIRRGDYATYAGGKYYYGLQEYCQKMLELQEAEQERKFRFVICSNDEIDSAIFRGLDFFKGPGHLVEDLYIFANCDFLMGPPSTYTRWASFYGKKPLLQLSDLKATMILTEFKMLPSHQLFDF